MPRRRGERVEVGVWMGVLFGDGPDKRCRENIVNFLCSNLCRACFKMPYLCCINDQKNLF